MNATSMTPMNAVSISAWKKRKHSEANVLLNEISAALDDLAEKCHDFLESHGTGCPCPFCSHKFDRRTTDGELLENDVRGLLYNVESSKAILSGEINTLDHEELELARRLLDAGLSLDVDEEDADAFVVTNIER